MTPQELVVCAIDAQQHSYAPYSEFTVGAALLTHGGKVYKGCNIENKSFSPTVCAERVAIFKAISEGETDFDAIAIVGKYKSGEYKHFCTPCGVCRQVLSEFCAPEFKIILGDDSGDCEIHSLKDLLPQAF